MKLRKTILSDVKSLWIPISAIETNGRLTSMGIKCHETGCVNLAKPDYYVSRQDTVAFRTDVRYTEVTKSIWCYKKIGPTFVISNWRECGGRFTPTGVYASGYSTVIRLLAHEKIMVMNTYLDASCWSLKEALCIYIYMYIYIWCDRCLVLKFLLLWSCCWWCMVSEKKPGNLTCMGHNTNRGEM